MRHRKKLIFSTLLVLAAYATVCFWPHSNPEAVRALTMLRALADDEPINSEPAAKPPGDTQVEVSLVIATLNITDATRGLFSQPDDDARLTIARVADAKHLDDAVQRLRSLGVLEVVLQPQMQAQNGQTAGVYSSGEVVVVPPAAGAAPPGPVVRYRELGERLEVKPEIRDHDVIRLNIDYKLTWISGRQSATAPKGAAGPNIQEMRATADGEVKPGETLVIGGLTKKWDAPTLFRLPLLSDLPGVGEWLQFRREREIEEELIILATPRIIVPSTRRDTQRAAIYRLGEQGVDD